MTTKVVLMLAALVVLLVFHMWAGARPRRLWYLGAIAPVIWLGVLIWMAVAGLFVPAFIYNIGTVVLNGGISMVIFFFVNKVIFPEGEAKKN